MKNRYLIIGIMASLLVPSLTSYITDCIDEHGVSLSAHSIPPTVKQDFSAIKQCTNYGTQHSIIRYLIHYTPWLICSQMNAGRVAVTITTAAITVWLTTHSIPIITISTLYQDLYNVIYASNVVIENVKLKATLWKEPLPKLKCSMPWAISISSLCGTPPLVDHTLKAGEYSQGNCRPNCKCGLSSRKISPKLSSSGALTEKSSQIKHIASPNSTHKLYW